MLDKGPVFAERDCSEKNITILHWREPSKTKLFIELLESNNHPIGHPRAFYHFTSMHRPAQNTGECQLCWKVPHCSSKGQNRPALATKSNWKDHYECTDTRGYLITWIQTAGKAHKAVKSLLSQSLHDHQRNKFTEITAADLRRSVITAFTSKSKTTKNTWLKEYRQLLSLNRKQKALASLRGTYFLWSKI